MFSVLELSVQTCLKRLSRRREDCPPRRGYQCSLHADLSSGQSFLGVDYVSDRVVQFARTSKFACGSTSSLGKGSSAICSFVNDNFGTESIWISFCVLV